MASQPPPSTDDLFASLGGSLMKDLWADLQAGDTEDDEAMMGWSLEQLERELAHLEDEGPEIITTTTTTTATQLPPPGMPSAASLVVSHAQERMAYDYNSYTATTPTTTATVSPADNDAWSVSLQNFAASSLEQDFLAANTARKKQTTTVVDNNNEDLLRDVQDYNVSELVTAHLPLATVAATTRTPFRPPGMPSPAKQTAIKSDISNDTPALPPLATLEWEKETLKRDEAKVMPSPVPTRRVLPPTPQNSSVSFGSMERVPPTPHNSSIGSLDEVPPPPSPPMQAPVMMVSPMIMQQQHHVMQQQHQQPPQRDEGKVVPPVPRRVPRTPQNSSVSFGSMETTPPPKQQQQQQAWQSSSRPQVQVLLRPLPTKPVYCQPDPSAPPIPSVALESSLMKARDLAYVLHSMLKPILIAGVSLDDYNVLLWQRRSGQMQSSSSSPRPSSSKNNNLETEMTSRCQRSKEWMAEHSTLGHVAKADSTRPRALIAVHTATTDNDDDETSNAPNKERATLWKARLIVDQGYQAYRAIVQVWKLAPPGTVPRQVQPHLVKLLKCLGMKLEAPPTNSSSSSHHHYTVDETALSLFLKLPKGQVLLARILEQALLPPRAVQALLPVALSVATSSSSSSEDVRLFRSFATVITTLPNMDQTCLLECVKAVQHPNALSSTSRMECIHALLQRGHAMSTQDASFAPEWAKTEQEFMKLFE